MTQQEIVRGFWERFNGNIDPLPHTDYFNYHCGAMTALDFAHRQFKELLDEHFGDDEKWRDEKEDMLYNFEQRIGIEE